MKLFYKPLFSIAFLLIGFTVFGQTSPDTTNKQNSPDTTRRLRDPQNQLQFLEPDMKSKEYNFYKRRDISTPQMMGYDYPADSAVYQRDKQKIRQQRSYKNRQYHFPAKPKDAWEIGVNFGFAFISGDVKPYVHIKGLFQNMGFGFTVRKAIGYTFSFRGGYNYMMMTGRNWEPDGNLKFNPALHGLYDPRVNYWNNPALLGVNNPFNYNMNKLFFYNYRTQIHEFHLEGVMNLGNIRFHKERNMVNFYFLGGVSTFLFTTKMDALDANGNVYDFSAVHDLFLHPENYNVNQRNTYRKQALDMLNKLYDGKYESDAEHENNVPGFGTWQFVPAATVGFGLQFHISKWVTFGLEERVILTASDLLDGYRWQQDEHASFTTNVDNIAYTSLNFNFHIGLKKRTEPMYWLNPMYHPYKKIGEMDPESIADELFKDDDGDGVPNRLDKEPNTKKDCPTDVKGVALDSDKDGYIDCDDKEPYSPPGYPVDSTGVAILPPNPCCDTSGRYYDIDRSSGYIDENDRIVGPDGVVYPPGTDSIAIPPDGHKVAVSSLPKVTEKDKGRPRTPGGYDCSKIELPDVIFDFEKYYLDPQYFGNLHQIAERLQMCPDMKLVVTGFDESRNDQKFNEQLAWNRSNAAVDYLTEKYGISRDRFIVKYKGGKKAATGTPYEKKMKSKASFRYANEGETGDSNPPAPHPGLKAGSNK